MSIDVELRFGVLDLSPECTVVLKLAEVLEQAACLQVLKKLGYSLRRQL